MRIDNLTLKNFRNFENAEIPLNPKMNIVIGNNGSGKSSLLMGALTAASTFFLGIDYASPRSIKTEDVRHVAYETNKIYQQREVYPVEVSCQGVINGNACTWSRSLSGPKSNTTYGAASDLKKIASELQKEAALPSSQTVLPLIAYYGTGRLWAQKQAKQKEKQKLKSRFEGYQDCIAEQATDKQLMEWFSDMTLLVSQEGPIPQVSAVQRALERCFADLIDHDETQHVKVEYRQRYRTDLIGLQAAEAAAVLAVVDLEQELPFGVQHIDVVVVAEVKIARRVDGEGRDVAAHAILLVRAIVGHGEVDIGDRAAIGGNVHEVGRAHVRRGVVILVHGVGIEVRGQVILCRIDVHEHPERAVVGACHVVAVNVALAVLGNRGQLQVGKLGARAGIGVDRQKDQLLGVIRPGVARVRVGLDDLVALHVGGQEDRRARGAHRVDVLDVLGQLQVEVVGLIGVFRRRGGGLGLVDERAAGVGLAALRIRVFRAARKQAHHKQSRQRERKKAFEFHAVLLFHSETICCTVI